MSVEQRARELPVAPRGRSDFAFGNVVGSALALVPVAQFVMGSLMAAR